MGMHLVLLSQQADLLLPRFVGANNDQLAKIYNSSILDPLNRTFGSNALGTLSTALFWGITGLLLYTVLDFIVSTLKELKASDKDIAMPLKDRVVYHPLHQQLVIRLLWRFFVGMLLVVVTIALQSVISGLFNQDVALLRSVSAVGMLEHAGIVLAGWAAVFHVYVVLFRLFVLRTRIFGEILY